MAYNDLLTSFIRQRRDVTFPVHVDDAINVAHEAVPYGFNGDGTVFKREWNITPRPGEQVRLVASFTGTVTVKHENFQYFILIYIFSLRPYLGNDGLPDWYPIPKYAKYGPFSLNTAENIIGDLLLPDDIFSTVRRTYLGEHAASPLGNPDRDFLKTELLNNRFDSGIPISAGSVLFNIDAGVEVKFSLHPEDFNRILIDDIYFNPNFYFTKWSQVIENYSRFDRYFKQTVLAPPVTNRNIRYVSRDLRDIYPSSVNYTNIVTAYTDADTHDCILVVDDINIENIDLQLIDKYVSIIGLKPPSDDVKRLDQFGGDELVQQAKNQYPNISRNNRTRGLRIDKPAIEETNGLIYLQNLAICGNLFDVTMGDDQGGAGILVNGANRHGELYGFSSVHIHNCAIVGNRMVNFPRANPSVNYIGGGIFCYNSSPIISDCLIKENYSFCHGGGIGVFNYSWPYIMNNLIAYNVAMGNPFGDFDNGNQPGGNGDGGGIGIFQAYPENRDNFRDDIWREPLRVDVVESIANALRESWDRGRLDMAKTKFIKIINNTIRRNRAEMSGGGVYATVCACLSLSENRISNNFSIQQDGGGVEVTFGSRLIMKNDIVEYNHADHGRGGGIYIRSSRASIENVSIRNNTSIEGGGIAVLSIPEISTYFFLLFEIPLYDIIQNLIFNHIDLVRLAITNTNVTGNFSSSNGLASSALYVLRDQAGFQIDPRSNPLLSEYVRSLNIELVTDSITNIIGNVALLHKFYRFTPVPQDSVADYEIFELTPGVINI